SARATETRTGSRRSKTPWPATAWRSPPIGPTRSSAWTPPRGWASGPFRLRDAESGTTSIGPHRSDLAVRHLDLDLPAAEGSTGQQKALLVSVSLAHARLVALSRGRPPLLLLDEIAAHLDAERRSALFDEVLALGVQSWMTGTDAELFKPLAGRAQVLRVVDGSIAAT